MKENACKIVYECTYEKDRQYNCKHFKENTDKFKVSCEHCIAGFGGMTYKCGNDAAKADIYGGEE